MDILAAKAVPIQEVALRLGLDEPTRGKIRCISKEHKDSHPSMSLGGPHNRFKCFACGLGGDVLDLICITLGIPPKEAYNWLMGDTKLPNLTPIPVQNRNIPRLADTPLLANFWKLCDTSGDYLAPKLLNCGRYGVRMVTEAANRLIPEFPIGGLFIPYYQHGTITYGRWRNIGATGPRFLALPNVDTIMYNQDALSRLDGVKPLYLCEGESDTMTLDSLGSVAIGFPGATQHQLFDRLMRYVRALEGKIPEIVLAFDNDLAGNTLAAKIRELDLGLPTSILDLGTYNDVNEAHIDGYHLDTR